MGKQGGPHPEHCRRQLSDDMKAAHGNKTKVKAAMRRYSSCRLEGYSGRKGKRH